MTKAILWGAAAIAAAAAAFACSSSSGGGGGGGGNCNPATAYGGDDACYSCLQSSCGSQLSAYESGCSDYISCICSSGDNASALQSCESKAEEGSCTSVASNVGSCIQTSCSAQCNSGSASSSGGTTSSSGGTTSSSGGGTETGSCATLATCCGQQSNATEQQECDDIAQINDQGTCTQALTEYMEAGLCQ